MGARGVDRSSTAGGTNASSEKPDVKTKIVKPKKAASGAKKAKAKKVVN